MRRRDNKRRVSTVAGDSNVGGAGRTKRGKEV